MKGKTGKKAAVLFFSLAMIAAGCSGGSGDSSDGTSSDTLPEPGATGQKGGTLVWAVEQEPNDLHVHDPLNSLQITSYIRAGLIEGLFGFTGDTQYVPELLVGEPEIEELSDGGVTISYELRGDLQWSDGEPLTSGDVEYTYNIFTEGCAKDDDGSIVDNAANSEDENASNTCTYLFTKRTEYETITSFDVESDTKFSITMSEFNSGWKELFNEVYAAHAFGANAEEVNQNLGVWANDEGILPSSGPLLYDEWDRGVSLSLKSNPDYHGSVNPDAVNIDAPFVDGVRIDWVADTDTQIAALQAGEANIIVASPQLQFGDLNDDDSFTVLPQSGPTFEHWGLNVLNPHLAKSEVREAIAYALDKGAVVESLYAPVYGDTLPEEGLGNTYLMPDNPFYEDHQTEYAGPNIDAAKEKLEEAGYTQGDDGIFIHPEEGRLSLRSGTTGGNQLRETQQQLIQEQMKLAGIDIVIENIPGSDYFSETVNSDDSRLAAATGGAEGNPGIWDITQFHWAQGPWPGEQSRRYAKDGSTAFYGFQNEEFDVKSKACDVTVDDDERMKCWNEIDKYATTLEFGDDGLFMLPLSQKPSFYGYTSDTLSGAGVAPDVFGGGPLVNVGDFQFKAGEVDG